MTRETKIGIALMMLLVGVFGFIVYRKWNDRQPTAIAAAAEVDSVKIDAEAATAEMASKPVASKPATAPPAQTDPFAVATSPPASRPVPAAQAEPTDPFGDSALVPRDEASAPLGAGAGDAQSMASAPPAQTEPIGSADSPFDDARGFVPVTQRVPAAGADAALPDPTEQPATIAGLSDGGPSDPFADAATAEPATSDATTEVGDPFGDVAFDSTEPIEPIADPIPAATEDPLSESEDITVPASIASGIEDVPASSDPFAEAASAPVEASAGSAEIAVAGDPFSSAEGDVAASRPADEEEPLVSEDAAVPVAGTFDAASESEPSIGASETSAAGPFSESVAPTGRAKHYVVAEGDNYWVISKQVYGTPVYFHALAKYNAGRIADPKRLRPGMVVLTPAPSELATRFPNLVSEAASTVPEAETGEPGFLVDEKGRPAYRVGDEDTLTGIAQAHLGRASRWVQIYQMNRDAVPDAKTLRPGTVLRLPGDASRVRLVPEG